MAKSNSIVKYKQKIMSKIINDDRIVKLINNKNIETNEDLIYDNCYNYIRIPVSVEEEKTFICIECDIDDNSNYASSNNLINSLIITIYVITHENLMRTNMGGTRTDLISARIDDILSGRKIVGLTELELLNNIAGTVNDRFKCRVMTFLAKDWNKDLCEDDN